MAPIYDTDIAEERWSKSQWEHYELWEKVEYRLKRHRRMWILATMVVFVMISSIPIIMDKWPKWISLTATRELARQINRIKREASIDHTAYLIRFETDGVLAYVVEKKGSCSEATEGKIVRTGSLLNASRLGSYSLLTQARGEKLGVPGLVGSFCYDYLAGSDAVLRNDPVIGFAIGPVKDLTESRIDRISTLLLSGPSAEISFE